MGYDRKTIHTIISSRAKRILEKYGDSVLNDGIERVIEIAERKAVTPNHVCFNCRHWDKTDIVCGIINKYPTNSLHCEIFKR